MNDTLNSLDNQNFKLLVFAFFLFLSNLALAQLELKKFSINSGGGKLTGGAFEIHSSIGQTGVTDKQTADQYTLTTGHWSENLDLIFKNGIDTPGDSL